MPWRDVLNPAFQQVPWLFEHAPRRRLRAIAATLWLAATPGRFFTVLGMRHEVRPRRLVEMLVAVMLAGHVVLAVVALAGVYAEYMINVGSGLWRPMEFVEAVRDGEFGWVEEVSLREELLTAAVLPASAGLGGLAQGLGRAAAILLACPTTGLVAFHLVAGAMLWLLSDTRSMARVRGVHLLRATAYPLAVSMLLVQLAQLTHWAVSLRVVGTPWDLDPGVAVPVDAVLALIGLAWGVQWWRRACTRYMQLPSSRLVASVVVFIAMLAAAVGLVSAGIFLDPWRGVGD